MENKIQNAKNQVNVSKLFGYTGVASLVCAANGAKVTTFGRIKNRQLPGPGKIKPSQGFWISQFVGFWMMQLNLQPEKLGVAIPTMALLWIRQFTDTDHLVKFGILIKASRNF